MPSTAAIENSMRELRRVTRTLNLHTPPPYFSSSTTRLPYEDALTTLVERDDGPLHLYIGVPLCEEHCRFCMYFYGYADPQGRKAAECLDGIERLLAVVRPSNRRRAAGMYVGGGTPSVLDAEQIDRLLTAVNGTFTFETRSQCTFEMSPGTFSRAKVAAVARSGVTRVSFGLQSFDPAPVAAAGRAYVGPWRIAEILRDCVAEGIEEVNVDLMVGLDRESDTSLSDSVDQLLRIGDPVISIYRYRQARQAELIERGGLDEYVKTCTRRVLRAIEAGARHGREASGRADGEHIRLVPPGGLERPERNLYETRYRPQLGNSLVGFGSGARSFEHDRLFFHLEHQASKGFDLLGRQVEVSECNATSRLAAALVNELFRDFEADVKDLLEVHGPDVWGSLAPALKNLEEASVLRRADDRLVVAEEHREDWVYWEKLLYPAGWLQRRQEAQGLRIR